MVKRCIKTVMRCRKLYNLSNLYIFYLYHNKAKTGLYIKQLLLYIKYVKMMYKGGENDAEEVRL